MRAMVIDRFGGSEEFRLANVPVPDPGAGEVRIRAAYASVNPADWKGRKGLLPNLHSYAFPMTIGMDCAGVVDAVGAGVSDFRPGDRVMTLSGFGLGPQGTYAEYSVSPQERVAHVPANLTMEEAATIPIASASAASSIIEVAKVKPGDRVFLNGGGSSVGIFGVQYLRSIGARVAATCSTRNVDYVRGLGAELVIDYTKEDVLAAVCAWAPDGVDSVIDAIGLHSLPRHAPEIVRDGGIFVVIQTLITSPDDFDVEAAAKRGVAVVDNVRAAFPVGATDGRMFQVPAFRMMVKAIGEGKVKTPPYEIVPLEKAGEAHDRVEGARVRGKLLLKIADI